VARGQLRANFTNACGKARCFPDAESNCASAHAEIKVRLLRTDY
jgi:hypothetical protein